METDEEWLRVNRIPELFDKLTMNLVNSRPTDVLAYIQTWCTTEKVKSVETKASSDLLQALAPPTDQEEMDTAGSEDALDVHALVLPDGKLPKTPSKCFLCFSMEVLSGWVKQASPACAAAAAAGAWNAVRALHRNHLNAASQDIVLEILRDVLREKIRDRKGKAERLILQNNPFDVVEDAVRQYLQAEHGLTLGGASKSVPGATKAQIWNAVKWVTLERKPPHQQPNIESTTIGELFAPTPHLYLRNEPAFLALRDLWRQELCGLDVAPDTQGASTATSGTEREGEISGNGGPNTTNVTSGGTAMSFSPPKKKLGFPARKKKAHSKHHQDVPIQIVATGLAPTSHTAASSSAPPVDSKNSTETSTSSTPPPAEAPTNTNLDAAAEDSDSDGAKDTSAKGPKAGKAVIMDTFHFIVGLDKLYRVKPNTAVFGNWGVQAAIQRLNDRWQDMDIRLHYFMGRKAKGVELVVPLTSKDSPQDVDRQWSQLCAEFRKEHVALVFHLRNHYALIFALREWVDESGKHVQQLLTARRGQRPTCWMDWDEARNTMLTSVGYKIMVVQKLM
eukprot:TRINITY_DN67276_c8_g1_i1.p1 TRINITY_DN67276_c8_g1~~TRINITY_DN67276_c8_g1_i1.p1  ORF type:complete len:563 (-),score=58.43 TRINITY_DN67276_c8_g1_i1:76-1764(-)